MNKDVAFFHAPTKSLIVADLLFNLPPTEQYSKSKSSARVPLIGGSLTPYTWLHRKFAWSQGSDKDAMRRDAKTVAGWDFTRIIPCHGVSGCLLFLVWHANLDGVVQDVIENDGKRAWESAYADYLH